MALLESLLFVVVHIATLPGVSDVCSLLTLTHRSSCDLAERVCRNCLLRLLRAVRSRNNPFLSERWPKINPGHLAKLHDTNTPAAVSTMVGVNELWCQHKVQHKF